MGDTLEAAMWIVGYELLVIAAALFVVILVGNAMLGPQEEIDMNEQKKTNDWNPWYGGPPPVSGSTIVDIRTDDGEVVSGVPAVGLVVKRANWLHARDGVGHKIVAYRVSDAAR